MTKSWVIATAGAAALVLAGLLLLSSRDQAKSILTPPVIPTVVSCDLTLESGAELGSYLNDGAYSNEVICLSGGDYTLTRPQHTPGVKVYALHPARVWGWVEAYGAGEEWHGDPARAATPARPATPRLCRSTPTTSSSWTGR
jgi:hypothetical protein